MSAYIVSECTIQSICRFARDKFREFHIVAPNEKGEGQVLYRWQLADRGKADINELGQILVDQNYASVNFRYRKNTPAPRFEYDRAKGTDLTPVEFLKQLDCLEYQSCETEDWNETHAARIIRGLARRTHSLLPGYEDAPWGLT